MSEITHQGGEYAGHDLDVVRPRYRGAAKAEGVRIRVAPARRLDWSHDGGNDDIVAYEIVEPVRQ